MAQSIIYQLSKLCRRRLVFLFRLFLPSASYFSIMKVSSPRTIVSARDFRLLFSVRSIIFHRPRPLSLRIYLQKDVQVIGVVPQLLPALPAGTHRCFSEFTPPIEFRMAGERASAYSVSLYEVEEAGEHHLETAELRFNKFLEDYCREFQELEEELGSEVRGGEAGGLAKAWKTLSARFSKRVYTSAVRFPKAQGLLEFALEPVHPYDEAVREVEQAEQRRRERRERQEDVYKKTRTISDSAQVQNESPLRRGLTDGNANISNDSDLTLMAPFQFESRKQISPNKCMLPMKSGLLKENQRPVTAVLKGKDEVLSNIAEVSDSFQSFANSNKTNHNQILGESKRHRRLELPIMKIGEKRPSAEEEQEERVAEVGLGLPASQERWLVNSMSRPHEMLGIESGIEIKIKAKQASELKQRVWTSAFLLVGLLAVYFLMHPLPRV